MFFKLNFVVVDDEDISSAEARVHTPHPTGIKLTRPGYYTLPSLDDLIGIYFYLLILIELTICIKIVCFFSIHQT